MWNSRHLFLSLVIELTPERDTKGCWSTPSMIIVDIQSYRKLERFDVSVSRPPSGCKVRSRQTGIRDKVWWEGRRDCTCHLLLPMSLRGLRCLHRVSPDIVGRRDLCINFTSYQSLRNTTYSLIAHESTYCFIYSIFTFCYTATHLRVYIHNWVHGSVSKVPSLSLYH